MTFKACAVDFEGRNLQHKLTERFERQWSYDASYLHEIIEMAPDTLVRFQQFQALASFQGAAPDLLTAGATLGAMLEEDCGPCAQLTVDMLLARGVSPSVINALIDGAFDRLIHRLIDRSSVQLTDRSNTAPKRSIYI